MNTNDGRNLLAAPTSVSVEQFILALKDFFGRSLKRKMCLSDYIIDKNCTNYVKEVM